MVGTSCSQEKGEAEPEAIKYLPNVVSTKPADINTINEVLGAQRTSQEIESINATVAQYEGYDDFEFVYVSEDNNELRYSVYVYNKGVLVPDFKLNLMNYDNSLVVETENGKVVYTIEDNFITNVSVIRNNDGNSTRSTESSDQTYGTNDVFQDYLDCGDAITDQAADLICGGCGFGKLAFGIGCSAWVVCRGASIVTCTTYALTKM